MSLRVCPTPGCPDLTPGGPCDNCRKARQRRSDQHRPSSRQRGYDQKWARTRGRYLQLHPHCSEQGCDQPATEVHHIDGRGPSGPDGHKHHNLQGYCKPHHAKVTAQQQPGGWAA